ncbi:hypothetical protein E4K72_05965 [Oxalobacteraceae bacterium OM1]|nr:hypothetical protein E4K72_05965 [Oxalobacteraceae bacterium OM1]
MKKSRYSDEQIVRILREADKAPIAKVAKLLIFAISAPVFLFNRDLEARRTRPVRTGVLLKQFGSNFAVNCDRYRTKINTEAAILPVVLDHTADTKPIDSASNLLRDIRAAQEQAPTSAGG